MMRIHLTQFVKSTCQATWWEYQFVPDKQLDRVIFTVNNNEIKYLVTANGFLAKKKRY